MCLMNVTFAYKQVAYMNAAKLSWLLNNTTL